MSMSIWIILAHLF